MRKSSHLQSLIDRLAYGKVLARWQEATQDAAQTDVMILRRQAERARDLNAVLEKFQKIADVRLALPHVGANAPVRWAGADWVWRPDGFRYPLSRTGLACVADGDKLNDEIRVFHDCSQRDITLRQQRNTAADDLAPFGVVVEAYEFSGTFLSLAITLPDAALQGLTRRHLLGLEMMVTADAPIAVNARLNIRHGPNVTRYGQDMEMAGNTARHEFDLSLTDFHENRVDRVWIDLFLTNVTMNQITIRDMVLFRRPRAEV